MLIINTAFSPTHPLQEIKKTKTKKQTNSSMDTFKAVAKITP
jgi:hypothetical protein